MVNEVTGRLAALVDQPAMVDAEQAAQTLRCSVPHLCELAQVGELDVVVTGGQVWVPSAGLAELVQARARARVERVSRAGLVLKRALAGFLAEREVCGDYQVARTQQRPLLCAQRSGARGVHRVGGDLKLHAVVLRARWLVRWALEQDPEVFPEVVSLPVGATLREMLLALPGVWAQGNVTAFDRPGHPYRVLDWVRVDPEQYPVRIPAELEQRVRR